MMPAFSLAGGLSLILLPARDKLHHHNTHPNTNHHKKPVLLQ